MAQREGINTSLGRPGDSPEERSFGRLYHTLDRPVNDYLDLVHHYTQLRLMNKKNPHRRVVLKCLCPGEVIGKAIKDDRIPVEAVIPMNIVTGVPSEDSAIAFISSNSHHSPRQGQHPKEIIVHKNGKKPIEKIQRILNNGFFLSNRLEPEDSQDLLHLWERFGWSQDEVINFIGRIQAQENNLMFSGIRDGANKLVAVSIAEAVVFAGLRYYETTEYSTHDGFEGQGLCTASVAGLVAQILSTNANEGNEKIPVVTAEFNTCSTSVLIGASVGLEVPMIDGVPQILSYNVAVNDRSEPNPIFANDDQQDRGIPYRYLRDFAVGVLPKKNIVELYPPEHVERIMDLYN